MKSKRFFALTLFSFFAALSLAAFSFTPMSASIAPSGSQSVLSFRVNNNTTQSIAVVIKVMTRSIDQEGVETNTEVGKDFVVFPTRVVVQPNSFQTVKVQYKGVPNPPRELSYRVIAEQVPIDFSKQETSGVKVLFKYIAALYVTPPRVSAKLSIDKAVAAEKDGVKGLRVIIRNDGTRHALVTNPQLKLQESASALPIVFANEQVANIDGQNILPASGRAFFIPWDGAQEGVVYTGTITAEIE